MGFQHQSTSQKDTSISEQLPSWDLSDFYASPQDSKVEADLQKLSDKCHGFAEAYEGKITLSSETKSEEAEFLSKSIEDLEQIEELMGKLMSYAFLNFTTQIDQPQAQQFYQKIQEAVTQQSAHLIFITLDLNKLEEDRLQKAYELSATLKRYKPWIDVLRLYKNHQLTPDLEKLFMEKSLTSSTAWNRLYDETLEGIEFAFQQKKLPLSEILDKLSHKDPVIRKEAAESLSKGLVSRLPVFALVTNTLIKDKEIEDTWRHYPNPVSSRNLANQVEDEVVEALSQAVKQAYPKLSHRYYALKAKWFGVSQLAYWDRNAPLPESSDVSIPWTEAKKIVYGAYHRFSPELADLGQRFFDKAWIDVPAKAGKRSGAFAHPTVPSLHPYLMLNYQGKLRDVMTLAHELGNGVHQVLASDQGYLLSQTPLTVAETASVFGEMLTFRALLEKTKSPEQRRSLIAAKVEDMLNTVVRQCAFFDFEKRVHTQRKLGELSPDQLGDIWMETQGEALGPAVQLDPIIRPYWSYISHFIHSPFYVYAYAFGDCLVNSLYSLYQNGHPDFVPKYLDLLRAGGSKRYPELLAPFGLDAKDPLFWAQGLTVISNLIDELEQMEVK